MSWVELETKVAEDYAKFYNHGEWAYSMIVKLRVIFGNLRFKLYSWARTLQSTRHRLASRTLMLTSGSDGGDWKKSAEVVLYIF